MEQRDKIKTYQNQIKILTARCKFFESQVNKMKNITTDTIDKLADAAKIIQDQNELLECLYAALGNRSNDIVNTWKTMHKIREKKNRKD